MRQLIAFGLILGLMACSTEAQESSTQSTYRIITVDEFKEKMNTENVQIIDVRTSQEFLRGTIYGAMHIDVLNSNFEKKIKELDPTRPTLVFCAKGSRSAKASAIMKGLSFVEIYDLSGGFAGFR
ncbi:MAG: rhodanese-like domain-containing protein [Crocinitomicaceae bacterium]|nr:rhodanese-like domain-containing protein [Crocinitomicaceae bacterium]